MSTARSIALTLSALLGAVGAAGTAAAAEAPGMGATISVVEGAVLVARDDGIVPGAAGMELLPLQRVMVLENSQAIVSFRDGCERELPANSMLTVAETGNCETLAAVEQAATGLASPATTRSSFAAAAGAPSNPAGLLFGAGAAGAAGLGTGGTAAVVGAGLLGVGVVAAIVSDDDDDDDDAPATQPPISPQ